MQPEPRIAVWRAIAAVSNDVLAPNAMVHGSGTAVEREEKKKKHTSKITHLPTM